jgi:hypothetical protein
VALLGHATQRVLLAKLVAMALVAPGFASVTIVQGHGARFATGGSDGAGGIPYAGSPNQSSGIVVPYQLTIGLVQDAQYSGVVGTPVIIEWDDGLVIAAGITDDRGMFQVELPSVSGLTLSLPLEGIFDVPVEAGQPVFIVLP